MTMKPRKQSNRRFLIGNFLPAYVSSISLEDRPHRSIQFEVNELQHRLPRARAQRRSERTQQYRTNFEIGLVAALLVAVLAFQLPLTAGSSSARTAPVATDLPPRPVVPVEVAEDVIVDDGPVALDATLLLDEAASMADAASGSADAAAS